MSRTLDLAGWLFVAVMAAAAVLVPYSVLGTPESSAAHMPVYLVQLLGKYLCYAILALALDLVWGYCGILSLGHGAFFALGGYAMGMYLMRQIGARGVYANPVLPDFMVFLNWKALPVAWWGFNWFPYALLMIVLIPGLLALAVDLVWGFAGILSLGHAAFFALGGYAMGMYLMRQIGTRGVYGNPNLPDFMVFLGWKELPWYWYGFDWFGFAILMALVVPAVLAGVFGWLAFRSRVTGVYLSIITQAMTYALLLAFFRNDFGFGGNNGLTDFKDILGFNVQADQTRAALFALSCLALILGFLICRAVVTSKLGKVLIAIRDAESRTRFLGYRVESYKLFVFTLSACMAGVAGALYVPQIGIINPGEFAPGNSIEAVIWVAVGGRGTLIGAALGAVVVNYAKTVFTSGPLAPYWLFMLGALFILVTLLLPKGIIGTFNAWWEPWKARRLSANAESAAREDGISEPNPAE